jgi:hypothetical protein
MQLLGTQAQLRTLPKKLETLVPRHCFACEPKAHSNPRQSLATTPWVFLRKLLSQKWHAVLHPLLGFGRLHPKL